VVGGGLAGLAAAWRLARAGRSVAVFEREPVLGGQAQGFRRAGRRYPGAYHHVNARDRTLMDFLRATGLLARVRWRPAEVACLIEGQAHVLASPRGLLSFPAPLGQKLRMARLAAACWRSPGAGAGADVDAATWLHEALGEGAFAALFDDLSRARLGVSARDLSAAWLRSRVASREGATRFGCVPGDDWASLLADALADRAAGLGAGLFPSHPVEALAPAARAGWTVRVAGGGGIRAETVVAALPPPILARLLPPERAASLPVGRWSFVVSAVMGVPHPVPLLHYWTNVVRPPRAFATLFRLDRLNPALASPGEAVVNLAAYGCDAPGALVREAPDRIVERFLAEWSALFGEPLAPAWTHVARIPFYSPVFPPGYRNPERQQPGSPALWLAGHALTWPEVASTGPALASGWCAAGGILRGCGVADEEAVG